jgi:hypothetical protein
MAVSGTFPRDANRVPITRNGLLVTKSYTFIGSNNTYNIPIFKIAGIVEVRALYGVVTTAIGVNHTASAFRLNDQSAQIYLTAVGGTDISAAPVGSMIIKNVLLATAVTLKSAAAGFVLEPSVVNQDIFSPVIVSTKTALTTTTIEYHYATTDTPTTGAMTFYCGFVPLSTDGDISPV